MKKLIIGIATIVVLTGGYAGAKVYASQIAEKKIEKAVTKASKYAQINYENVSVNLLNQGVHISDVVVAPVNSKEKFYINEIIVHNFDKKSDIPILVDISLNGIKLDLKKLGNDLKEINELGYKDQLSLNFAIKFNYDDQQKKLNLEKLTVGADEVGDIAISFQLGNFNLDSKPLIAAIMNPQLALHSAKITYHDDSLTERLFKVAAKEDNMSVEDFKKRRIEKIQQQIDKEDDPFTKSALQEVIVFINNPKSFSISATPEKPLPLGNIMMINEPKDAVKLLNIKIKS
ncbi:MAG: hypothetical protein GQ569_00645 [Methylococcaceae bacterium]|nr:hypothetical protein [Methylococcaceae bacterium]